MSAGYSHEELGVARASNSPLRWREGTAYILLGVAVLALYWRVRGFSFVNYDDYQYVVDNPALRQQLFPDGLLWSFTTFRGGNWHPLTWISHLLDVRMFGLDPGGPHLVNALLHAANALALLHVLRLLTGSLWRSAVVAAFFALHPIQVESVAWVSQRKDLLAALFWFLAMGAHARFVRAPTAARRLAVAAATALALLSKATAVTLPLALLLMDIWPLGRLRPGAMAGDLVVLLREKAELFLLVALKVALTLAAPQAIGAYVSLEQYPLGSRVANALLSSVSYLGKMAWPKDLAVLYPLQPGAPWGKAVLAAAALAAFSWLAARAFGKRPAVAVGWLWYLVVLLPMSGIIQVGPQVMADRYTYLPMAGVLVAAAWGVALPEGERQAGRRVPAAALIGVGLAACLVLSWRQIGTWRDSETLFRRAVAVSPHSGIARNNLAQALLDKGRPAEAIPYLETAVRINRRRWRVQVNLGHALEQVGRTEDSLVHFREAVRLAPDRVRPRLAFAQALMRRGRPAQAEPHFRASILLAPGDRMGYLGLGAALRALKRYDEAAAVYRALGDVAPDDGSASLGLGLSLARAGRVEEAVAHLQRAVELLPGSAPARYDLALALERTGRPDRAADHYRAAIAIDPGNAAALNNLGVILAELGRSREAAGYFERATQVDPTFVEARYNLGRALLAAGDAAGAAASFEAVLRLQPDHRPALEQLGADSAPRGGAASPVRPRAGGGGGRP